MGALLRLAIDADRMAARAAFEACLAVTASQRGLSIEEVQVRADPNAVRRRRPEAEARNAARREAVYLTVTHFGLSYRQVARGAGMSQVAVLKACRKVEEAREDLSVDRALDEAELDLMGLSAGVQ